MISLFNLYEFFPAFICASNTESLVNNLVGFNIFNPFPSEPIISGVALVVNQ